MEKPRTKKPLKKYGTESNRNIFDFHGDSDGDTERSIERSTDKCMGPRNMASSWGLSTGQTVALEDAGLFRVRPEAREKPGVSCMPPPTLSSASHTQISETNTMATSTGEDHTKSRPSKAKTTDELGPLAPGSSESRMPDPTMSSRGRGRGDQGPDMNVMEISNNPPGLDRDASELEPIVSQSKVSALSPSKTITVDRKSHGPQILIENDGHSDDEPLTALPMHHAPEQVEPLVVLPENSLSHEETDELSFPSHGPETWSINQTTLSKARKQKNDDMQADEPSSDDIAIGLPRDQYQPRPSRSRSGRGAEEVIVPADFSKRPEAAVKKKSRVKRSKTTAFHELRAKTELDEEEEDTIDYKPTMKTIEEIPPIGFEKTEELGLNKKSAKSDTDEHTQPNIEPITKAADIKKQRGRPKKGVTEAPDSRDSRDIDTGVHHAETKSDSVQHLAATIKAKIRTKAKQGPSAISEELVHDSDDEVGDEAKVTFESTDTLSGLQGNCATLKLVGNAAKTTSPNHETLAPAKMIETPPQTPPKADTPAQKGPDKHSPISSGKVAYRVGLSKRARIAPLLRIVRKA